MRSIVALAFTMFVSTFSVQTIAKEECHMMEIAEQAIAKNFPYTDLTKRDRYVTEGSDFWELSYGPECPGEGTTTIDGKMKTYKVVCTEEDPVVKTDKMTIVKIDEKSCSAGTAMIDGKTYKFVCVGGGPAVRIDKKTCNIVDVFHYQ